MAVFPAGRRAAGWPVLPPGAAGPDHTRPGTRATVRVCGPRSLERKTAPCASFTGLGAVSGTSSSRMALTRCESGRCAATHAEASRSRAAHGPVRAAAQGLLPVRAALGRSQAALEPVALQARAASGQSCSRTAVRELHGRHGCAHGRSAASHDACCQRKAPMVAPRSGRHDPEGDRPLVGWGTF